VFDGSTLPVIPIAAGAGGIIVLCIIWCICKKCKKTPNEVDQAHIYQQNDEDETIDPFSDTGKKDLKKL
jgi:hypothetical protein